MANRALYPPVTIAAKSTALYTKCCLKLLRLHAAEGNPMQENTPNHYYK